MLPGILKNATRSHHDALEACLDIPACLSTPESWLWLLETFHGYWSPVESAIFAAPGFDGWLPDAHLREKCTLLRRDIVALGGGARRSQICRDLPRMASLPERFGTLYVLEGSTLGGQIISRLASNYGYTPERGCAFFASYGPNTGSMWKQFCLQLEEYGAAHPDQQTAITGAAAETFEKFGEWISARKSEFSKSHDHAAERRPVQL